MGTISATELINQAAIQLLDTANTRWTRSELLGWLSMAQRTITLAQPYANAKTVLSDLVPGTRQSIPSDGWMLLDVYRDFMADQVTPVRAVRIIDRQIIDSQMPTWHAAAQTSPVQNYIYSLTDPLAYYVYPPSDGTHFLELNYSQIPADILVEANAITIPDIYAPVVLDYMLMKACMKDAEYAPGLQLATQYAAQVEKAIGADQASLLADNPDLQLKPKQFQVPGDK
jgi:hypothetical protein